MNKRGAAGERLIRDHLAAGGYEVLATNYRRGDGELDAVARRGGTVAFIEVKQRASARYGRPAEAVTPKKRARIVRTALLFAQEYGLDDAALRFDIIEVSPDGINHIENAFDATGVFWG